MFRSLARALVVYCVMSLAHVVFDSTLAAAQTDMIPASQITFVGPGGSDIGAWPITTGVTRVAFTQRGTGVEFAPKGALPVTRGGSGWPDTCVPFETCKEAGGTIDMGALQYSFGLVLKVNGQWFASAPIESWYGRENPGGAINDQTVVCPSGSGQIHCNWFYANDRWPNLFSARPQEGEQIGVFVIAGDARNGFNPLHERSNIVVLNLPATGAEVSFDFAFQSGESVHDTLVRVRGNYPALIDQVQAGKILNEVAWIHRAEGIVLLGKEGGHFCPSPSGKNISCDFLVNANTKHGWDVLVGSPDPGVPTASPINGPDGAGEDLSGALANGSRTLVDPVNPGGGTPTPDPTPVPGPGTPGPAGPAGPQGPKGDKGDPGDGADLSGVLARLAALEAQVNVLAARPVPASCSAALNLGGARIPISCRLNP